MKYGQNDIVIDDLTYKTNRFGKAVWARVGISSVGNTIVYAFGIVQSESNESMDFIHSHFLKAVDNKKPDIIIIDECAG